MPYFINNKTYFLSFSYIKITLIFLTCDVVYLNNLFRYRTHDKNKNNFGHVTFNWRKGLKIHFHIGLTLQKYKFIYFQILGAAELCRNFQCLPRG